MVPRTALPAPPRTAGGGPSAGGPRAQAGGGPAEAGGPAQAGGPATESLVAPPPTNGFTRFRQALTTARFSEWLPAAPCRLLTLDGPGWLAATAAAAGHLVVRVSREEEPEGLRPAGVQAVRAEEGRLDWLADASVDAVHAPELSRCLATEVTAAEIARVLRPGGRLLLTVDSLAGGLARLASDSRWAELADVPSADVVLVPDHSERLRRCFWPDELRSLLFDAGLAVEWVLPEPVLAPAAVEAALSREPGRLGALVATEQRLAGSREGDWVGERLVACARQPDR